MPMNPMIETIENEDGSLLPNQPQQTFTSSVPVEFQKKSLQSLLSRRNLHYLPPDQ